jgi:hypothetical protein
MRRQRYQKEDFVQLENLEKRAEIYKRVVENDYIALQINYGVVPSFRGMMQEIILAKSNLKITDDFNDPQTQTKMRTYSKKISIFFNEIEWVLKIFNRAEIEHLILRNCNIDEIQIY